MSHVVRAVDVEKLVLNEPDEVTSILQNVAVLLSTFKGSVPLQRDFGISPEILSKPINVARALLLSDVVAALKAYEPRVKVISVNFEVSKEEPGKLIPIVEVEIK